MKPILIFFLTLTLAKAQLPPSPSLAATTNADTNFVLTASWQPVSGAKNYALSEFAFGLMTNVYDTSGTNWSLTNPTVNNDYGCYVADESSNGVWSSNSPTVFYGPPNTHVYVDYAEWTTNAITSTWVIGSKIESITNTTPISYIRILHTNPTNYWVVP